MSDGAGAGAGADADADVATQTTAARALVLARGMPHAAPDTYIHAGDGRAEGRALARVCGAEALGTALLVVLAAPPAPAPLVPLVPAATAGLVVAMLVQCLSWVSGAQLNPCVTLAALCCRRMTARRALAELAAQLAGAAVGACLSARLLAGPPALTLPAAGVSLLEAVCVEALCTLCLVLANCAQWEEVGAGQGQGEVEGDRTWPLRIGAVVAALTTFAGPRSGASLNPTRSLGPALAAAHWRHHWVYWTGPLCGAALACLLHRVLRPVRPGRPGRVAGGGGTAIAHASAVALSTFHLK